MRVKNALRLITAALALLIAVATLPIPLFSSSQFQGSSNRAKSAEKNSSGTAGTIALDRLSTVSETSSTGPIEIELAGWTTLDVLPQELIPGPNPERYSSIRRGPSFGYSVRNLAPSASGRYNIEVYFSERASLCPAAGSFKVYFASDPDGPLGYPLFNLDLCASGTLDGIVRVAKLSILGASLGGRAVRFYFVATRGSAAVSHIRITPEGATDVATQIIPVDESRLAYRHHYSGNSLPTRPLDFSKLDVREAVISRFGSRHTVVAAPQRLAFMYSALGIDAADLRELVILVSAAGIQRALPLTDRYPLFDTVTQTDTPTGVRFLGKDPSLGLEVALDIKAPFWPQDELTSLLPSTYLDLTLTNTTAIPLTPEVTLAVPVTFDRKDAGNCGSCAPYEITPVSGSVGVSWSALEAVGEPSTPGYGFFGGSRTTRVEYALVSVGPALTEVAVSGIPGNDGFASSQWLPASLGSGIANTGKRLFRRAERGHTGIVWKPSILPPGTSWQTTAVLASHVSDEVVSAKIPSGDEAGYSFRYKDYFADLTSVVQVSVSQKQAQLDKASRFDSLISGSESASLGPSMQSEDAALNRLLVLAFRSYAANTWWLSRSSGSGMLPSDLFTVGEGAGPCCRLQSTVDVSYNDSALLLALWPQLVGKMLDTWPLYASTGGSLPGKVIPHDIGSAQRLWGQEYISMPVEENTNYTLLQYAHWKATGDSTSAAARLTLIKDLMRFVEASDRDGDGLPEEGVTNTIDAANLTLFRSSNQVYLGLKSAAAARAAEEISYAVGDPDQSFRERMDSLQHRVLHTLDNAAWRGDHFAVSLDASAASASLRNFGSIYPAGTLLYNLLYGGDLPLSEGLRERMLYDARSVASRSTGPYGSLHMERGETTGWISQSALRDMAALALGAAPTDGFVSNLSRYLTYQDFLSQNGDGGWWETFTYDGSAETGFAAVYESRARGVLGYYPRGAVLFAFAQSYAGITLDRASGIIGALPWARPGARVPLYTLADWTTGTVPVAVVQATDPPTLNVEKPTLASASLTVLARPRSTSSLQITPDTFAPSLGESSQILVTGLPSPVSLSAGHAGNWFYSSAASPPVSYVWDGISGTAAVADSKGTACVIPNRPAPYLLQEPFCADLSVDTNSARPGRDWYLAEGATGYGFETYILIHNPGLVAANVALTYMTPEGPISRSPLVVPPKSRRTIVVAADLPRAEVAAHLSSDQDIVVERSMYWRGADGAWREGHAVVATRRPSKRWYLPEGSTNWGFDEWVLLQNPTSSSATVTLNFVAQDGRTAQRTLNIEQGRRATIRVADVLPAADLATEISASAPIVAERAMYWGGPYPASAGGSASMGLVAPSHTWYFAEGSSDWGFDTWLLLQNPSDSSVAVDVVYMTQAGPRVRPGITMPPHSRQSISMGWDIGRSDSAIYVRASKPILAERSMYYSPDRSPAGLSRSGHASQGSSAPANSWLLAEGSTAHGLHEFVLVQNPGSAEARVQLSLRTEAGQYGTNSFVVGPGSRLTVYLNALVPEVDVSVVVSASRPVVVERAMYTKDNLGYLVMHAANAAKQG
ncbi:MAG: hypothetical protein C4319_03605 [Acidimicrobiia bacterium]